MSVQVNLMINQSDTRDVNKTLATYKMGINCNLKSSTELINPTIYLSKDVGIELDAFNYVYIPDFSRYYYVQNSSKELGGVIQIDCHVDVLMSHKDAIGNLTAIVERQEKNYNLYLSPLDIPNFAYRRIQTKQFPNQPLNVSGTTILLTSGVK